jgi:hypothetical protein
MTASKNRKERLGIGLSLCVALLMFFSPLVILHGAFAGDESVNGFHIEARLALLRSGLEATSSGLSQNRAVSSASAVQNEAVSSSASVPISLRIAWLAPLAIFAAFAYAALALLDLFLLRKATWPLAFIGGCLGLYAIVHLVILNSGLRYWTAELIASEPMGPRDDPSVALRILMAHSFRLSPGPGLYALTVCMFLASALAYSRAIPRIELVVRRSPRLEISETIRVCPLDPALPEETCKSVNVSRYGLYFETRATHYYSGMEARFNRNPGAHDSTNREERGSVVRIDTLGNGKHGVAMRIIFPVA